MMLISHTPAKFLTPGLHFELFQRMCTTVYVDKEEKSMVRIRFVMDDDNASVLNVLLISDDLIFEVHQ